MGCLGWPHREQARSHRRSVWYTNFVFTEDQLWERAGSGRRSDDKGRRTFRQSLNLELIDQPPLLLSQLGQPRTRRA